MTISRATLPNEFFDRTSAMMLAQPIPQFLFARSLYAASAAAELARNPEMFNTWRALATSGAAVPNIEAMQLAMADPAAELFFVTNELAAGPGHTLRVNRPVFSGGGYTEASRTIGASQTISTTPVDLTQEQVSITIKRVAGPYDTSNSRVAPRAIDQMDAGRAVHDLVQLVGNDLAYDRMAYLDTMLAVKFTSGASVYYPNDPTGALTSSGTTGDAAALVTNGDRPMNLDFVFTLVQKARDAKLPTFSNGRYKLFVTPQQARQLQGDPAYQRVGQFIADQNVLASAYQKTIDSADIYVCNTLPTDAVTVSGVTIHYCTLVAPRGVGYAGGQPCHVEPADDTNYGQTFKVIWVAIEGSSVLDNRFLIVGHTD